MGSRRGRGVAAAFSWLLLAGAASPSEQGADIERGGVEKTPLQVEIRTQLDFSRAASAGTGGGQISVDPNSGTRAFEGGVVDLGGSALAGSAIVRGDPGRAVRIDLPMSIRMIGSSGGTIEVSNLRTNLRPNPKLDAFGQLEFSFGGDLRISGNVSGTFRGRIPITAEYE